MSALLPTDTKLDRPRPSWLAYSTIARPSAPLCDPNPTRPLAGRVGPKVASSRTAGLVLITPRQFGPTSRMPAGRQHHQGSHARGRALLRDTDDLLGGDGQYREVDRARDLPDRGVGAHRLDHGGA